MTHIILNNFLDDPEEALKEVTCFNLSRYDNPFERKSFLALQDRKVEAFVHTPYIADAFRHLRTSETCKWVSRLLDVPVLYADFQHYGGLFVYSEGDYLRPHIDAGLHPYKNLRKVATALLYLTESKLDFYITEQEVITGVHLLKLKPNQVVLFANHDRAWHGVPIVQSDEPSRIVLTVSYLAPPDYVHPQFTNPRTRAYFMHLPEDTPELDALRIQRASEDGHEKVYRVKIGEE